MIDILNLNNCVESSLSYGGHGGDKLGIIYNNEKWFIKYPKSTKSLENVTLSYSTTPLSEYLGSMIYQKIGLLTHEVKLGIINNILVVICKDFLANNEMILDYNSMKNSHNDEIEKYILSTSSLNNSNNDLEQIMVYMDKNKYFKELPDLKKHFWQMFIIDALINNNDRNESNWGIIINKDTREIRIAPVYDNGASFYNKSDDNKFKNILEDDFKIKQVFFDSAVSIFEIDGKKINPLKYIMSLENEDCNEALKTIIPKIDLNEIENIFKELPNQYEDIKIISDISKDFYLQMLKYRYEKVLLPAYNNLIK